MNIIAVILILGILLAVVLLLTNRRTARDADWPYYSKKPLSKPEQILFHRLVKALPECIVLAQVQLSRVLGVKKGHNFGHWNNRINRMSLDFVICLKDSAIVAAIELDDGSHARPDRRVADAKKEIALKSAGIPLIRWNVSSIPSEQEIRDAIAK